MLSSPCLDLNGIGWVLKQYDKRRKLVGRPVSKKLKKPCEGCRAPIPQGGMYYAPVGRCMLVVCPGCMAKEWDAIYVPNAEADAAFISKLSAARANCVDDFDCFDIDVATEPAGLVQREAIAKQAQEVKKLQIKAAVAAVRTARGQGASGANIVKAVQEAAKRFSRPAQLPRSEDTSSRGGASIEYDYRRTYLVPHGACERWLSSAPTSRANLTERWFADSMNFVVQQTAEECADALAAMTASEKENARKLAELKATTSSAPQLTEGLKEREELAFMSHICEQRIVDLVCAAAWADALRLPSPKPNSSAPAPTVASQPVPTVAPPASANATPNPIPAPIPNPTPNANADPKVADNAAAVTRVASDPSPTIVSGAAKRAAGKRAAPQLPSPLTQLAKTPRSETAAAASTCAAAPAAASKLGAPSFVTKTTAPSRAFTSWPGFSQMPPNWEEPSAANGYTCIF